MTEARLILVRHGVTDWNREGRFQGHLDPPLGEDGLAEASLLAQRLASDLAVRPARIVSSSLRRAMQTATRIGDIVDVAVEPDARLIEIGQGRWEGSTHAELAVTDTRRYEAWRRAGVFRRPPGGETVAHAAQRCLEFLDEVNASEGPWPLCVVSHGGILRVVARLLFGLRAGRAWALDVDNASVSVAARIEAGWRMDSWNDTSHLLGHAATHIDEAEGRPLAL